MKQYRDKTRGNKFQPKREKPILEIAVVPKENEPFERTLKRFRKKVTKSGILREVRRRVFYEKPSEKRRREKKQNTRRCRKREAKEVLLKQQLEDETLKISPSNKNDKK